MKKPVRFVIVSVIVYAVLFIAGGGLIGVPLLSAILGGNAEATYLYILYWGLILLAGFIAVCTAIIAGSGREGGEPESKETEESGESKENR